MVGMAAAETAAVAAGGRLTAERLWAGTRRYSVVAGGQGGGSRN